MWPLLRCSQLNAADLRKNGRRCSPLRNQILVGSMKLVCPTSAEILLSTRTVSLEIMVIMTLAGDKRTEERRRFQHRAQENDQVP